MPGIHEELELHIKSLTSQEKMFLAKFISPSEISAIFATMRQTIAEEAKKRTQDKIANTFNKGYGNGDLFNSISYSVDGNEVKISSSKNYFAILNEGYGSFDMKKNLAGQNVKMRLPGGRVIYRKCGPAVEGNPRKNNKISQSTNGWIHPGYQGAHIDKIVKEEMEVFTADFVKATILRLINIAKSRAGANINGLSPGNSTSDDLNTINY